MVSPAMTIAVDLGRKATKTNKIFGLNQVIEYFSREITSFVLFEVLHPSQLLWSC